MSGDIEVGKCEVCGKEGQLQRKYWNYDVKCDCHSPNHFEMIRHCANCEPKEPISTKILNPKFVCTFNTDELDLIEEFGEDTVRMMINNLQAIKELEVEDE